MNKLSLIVLILSTLLNTDSKAKWDHFLSKFETMSLPVNFITEDYSVYDLFDNKSKMQCADMELLKEDCQTNSIFKFGYLLADLEKFKVLLYQQDVNEDTLYFKIATVNSQNKVVSSMNLMEYNGDGITVAGNVSINLKIVKTHREYLPRNPEEKGKIKVMEHKSIYQILDKTGEIKFLSKTSPQIKIYKMGKGEFIPIE